MSLAQPQSPAAGLDPESAAELFLTPRRSTRARVRPEGARPLELPFASGVLRGWEIGSGPRVLFVHGWEGDSTQAAAYVPGLRAAGFSLLAFDLPAHGDSDGRTAHGIAFAQALLGIQAAFGPAEALIAHSLGAAGAGVAISEGLQIQRLCLVAPAAEPGHFTRVFAAATGLPEQAFPALQAALERRVGRSFASFDVPRLLKGRPLPALVVHDPADAEVPYSHGERFVAALPQARLLPAPGAGHRRILSAPATVEAITRFLAAGKEPR